MIIIHCDASTKNGYSCYAYRSNVDTKVYVGVRHTMNTALAETVAVIHALSRVPDGTKVLIISDFKGVVVNIQNYRIGIEKPHNCGAYQSYRKARKLLFAELDRLNVDAVWIPSKEPNERHMEVDHMSRSVLNEYLRGNV